MQFPDNAEALGKATQNFIMLHGASLSEVVRDRLISALGAPSPVDRIVKTGEVLYAARESLNDDGKALIAGLISFASRNGWHGLGQDNRGTRIVMAMRRDLGEEATSGTPWPSPDDDPSPLAEYAPPAMPVSAPDQPQPTATFVG